MIRIAKDRCGYSGYVCKGAPKLSQVFSQATQVYDPVVYQGDAVPASEDMLHNYLNIPIKFKGMVTTVSPVFDMQDGVPSAPEVSCNNNLDPFNGGFIDAYEKYGSAVRYIKDDGKYYELNTFMPPFRGEQAPEIEVDPGIIEPMLDTEFDPVGITTLTGTDVVLDGLVVVLHYMTEWRLVIDDLLRKMAKKINGIDAISKTMAAENEIDECENFNIEKLSGNMVWKGTGFKDVPEFRVSGGTVYVNNTAVQVAGSLKARGTFKVFVNITYPTTVPGDVTASLGTRASGDVSIHIGGVAYTDSTLGEAGGISMDASRIAMYKIYRLVCNPAVGAGPTGDESGFVYYEGGSNIPYTIIPAETCDEDQG